MNEWKIAHSLSKKYCVVKTNNRHVIKLNEEEITILSKIRLNIAQSNLMESAFSPLFGIG